MDNVPAAWMWVDNEGFAGSPRTCYGDVPPGRITDAIPLYAAPPSAGLGGEWRGIDSCPENLMVLIACPNGTIWIASKDGDEWFGIEDDFGTVIEPSHWMNLPPPPAADDRGVEG